MTSQGKRFVTVIGPAHCDPSEAALAREVGEEIAKRGAVLVCGGRGGVMEAACQGAKEQGGVTVGILPGTDRDGANPYVDIPIVTGLGEARNAIVVRCGEAVIAISGGYGTLSEIGLALKMGRPVVGLATWELYRDSEPETPDGAVQRAASAAEAVELALATVSTSTERDGQGA